MANFAKGISIKQGKFNLKMSIKVVDFITWLNENVNEKGYVNTDIKARKEVGKYGDTHYLQLDEWKPADPGAYVPPKTEPAQQEIPIIETENDLPF